MSTERTISHWGEEIKLEVFNGQALIDLPIDFYYDNETNDDFDFPGLANTYFYVYSEREDGRIIKSFNQSNGVTRSGASLVFNISASDMTFEDRGKYYYELGYIRSGGYEQILRFGDLIVR